VKFSSFPLFVWKWILLKRKCTEILASHADDFLSRHADDLLVYSSFYFLKIHFSPISIFWKLLHLSIMKIRKTGVRIDVDIVVAFGLDWTGTDCFVQAVHFHKSWNSVFVNCSDHILRYWILRIASWARANDFRVHMERAVDLCPWDNRCYHQSCYKYFTYPSLWRIADDYN